jgi:Zn-dependent protease with chaperone function
MSPAPTQRRPWLSLRPQQSSLEEACRRAHAFASRHPVAYRWRVRVLLAFLILQPLLMLAILATITLAFPWAFRESELLRWIYVEPVPRWALDGLLFASLMPVLVIFAAGIVRGLTMRLPRPSGVPLQEQQAPRLFRLLAELSRSLDAPAVEEVLVSPEHVLEIRRQPCGSYGVFGPAKTVLLVGLPVAEELSPQHLRALLAHELAHLATHNRRLGGRVLGLRQRLAALRLAAEESALSRGYWSRLPDEGLVGILDGLIRRLTAATFPAARRHEAEGDAIAAAVAGRDFAAAALLRQRIAAHALTHQFQNDCLSLAESSPEPPSDLFDRRAAAACGAFTEAQIHAWLRVELEQKDNLADSHPPLWDRLRLLGFRLENMTDFRGLLDQVQPQRELGETAARFFLGDTAESLRAEFCREWTIRQAVDWGKRFAAYEGLRAMAADWEKGTATPEDSPDALWQIAIALGNTRTWRAALAVAQRVLEICPEHSDANLLTGQLLIEDGNRTGLEYLERAMKSDARVIPTACTLAARFLESRGERDAAAGYQNRFAEHQKHEQAIARERSQVRTTDTLTAADCPATIAEALRRAAERHASHIRAAYLMRKRVEGGDRRPLYVLGVERRSFPYENAALANRMLLERIMRFPGVPADVLVCVVTRANRALVERWKTVPQSLLFPGAYASASRTEHPAMEQTLTPSPAGLLRDVSAPAPLPARSSPAAAK